MFFGRTFAVFSTPGRIFRQYFETTRKAQSIFQPKTPRRLRFTTTVLSCKSLKFTHYAHVRCVYYIFRDCLCNPSVWWCRKYTLRARASHRWRCIRRSCPDARTYYTTTLLHFRNKFTNERDTCIHIHPAMYCNEPARIIFRRFTPAVRTMEKKSISYVRDHLEFKTPIGADEPTKKKRRFYTLQS